MFSSSKLFHDSGASELIHHKTPSGARFSSGRKRKSNLRMEAKVSKFQMEFFMLFFVVFTLGTEKSNKEIKNEQNKKSLFFSMKITFLNSVRTGRFANLLTNFISNLDERCFCWVEEMRIARKEENTGRKSYSISFSQLGSFLIISKTIISGSLSLWEFA